MRSINFVEGVIVVTSDSYTIDYAGGTIQVPISTNIDYTVEIPDADKSWITVADTRAVMRDETLTFTIAQNETLTARYSVINLIDALGVTSESILITQKSGTAKLVNVATAGTLDQLIGSDEKAVIEELTLTGNVNTFDFDFIKTMSNLKMLDMSDLSNTTLPASCLANTSLTTVLLPKNLTAIPDRAFYQVPITSLYIPETVKTIGQYAFYQCTSLKGNLIIPNATESIGDHCFQNTTFDGTLTLGNGLKTIGEYAFSKCTNLIGDLVIPDNVTSLGAYAFNECSGFTGNLIIGNGITEILDRTFFECSSLSGTISIGENVKTIGARAFMGNRLLTGNLIIPNSTTQISGLAFVDCESLTGYLYIGENVSSIHAGAFASSRGAAKWTGNNYTAGGLSGDYYPKEYVKNTTYYYPSKLNFSKVYCASKTPPSVAQINYYYGCASEADCYDLLLSIDLYGIGSKPGVFTNAMHKSNTGASTSSHDPVIYQSLVVPTGCLDAYKAKDGWAKCFGLIEENDF